MTDYIELHAQSAFSFLDGSSSPEDLAQQAAHLGYPGLALLDRDGVSGAPRFYKACKEAGIKPLVGATVTLEDGSGLPLLVASRTGYQNLCRLITRMKLRAPKGEGAVRVDEIEDLTDGLIALVRKPVLIEPLLGLFNPQNVYVELQRHLDRDQESLNHELVGLASQFNLPLLATNGIRYAKPEGRPLLDVLTCIKNKTTLEAAGKILSLNGECYLKSSEEMGQVFKDLPEAIVNSLRLYDRLDFTLEDLGYKFPDYPVPPGETMNSYLRKLTDEGARRRYRPYYEKAQRQVERELALIEKLNLAGYFLIVWDLIRFCKEQDILVQGRGSAANSAVCYSLEITAVDPVGMELLFERFLSEERGEWPDIDLDLPSGDRRERVIQYVYERYGEHGAAMTANVITYRERSASREIGKVLGFSVETLDRLARFVRPWEFVTEEDVESLPFGRAGLIPKDPRLKLYLKLWQQIQDLPRHLGQHSGGMVIAQGRLDTVVPLEKATMPGRSVVQWDKEDCADLGIIKVDLLGLGMMSALQDSLKLINASRQEVDLAHLPANDPEVYDMLQKADTVGVFQVESRAQMATLPRLKPDHFYDVVVQVAIIRPGPIVGQMVHPYLSRRQGREPVVYPHPSLEPILKRTLGVPLFQEQLLRIAMTAADFTGGEAEELRRAMGFKRSAERMRKIEEKLRAGMEKKGITGQAAEEIIRSITSFALYGFPESHAASFALLAYASAYLKVHFPAPFCASLLNNQPMGFYHPSTLVKDGQRHGLRIRPIDVMHSDWLCTVEDEKTVRLGLMYVRGLRKEAGLELEQQRKLRAFTSIDDLRDRVPVRKPEITTLAEIGALNAFGMRRREALWQVEKAWRPYGSLFRDVERKEQEHGSPLSDMNGEERLIADFAGTGMTIGPHPMTFHRNRLEARGVYSAAELAGLPDGRWVKVAGAVIVRQRPGTAKGFFFITMEDETGLSNIIVRPQVYEKEKTLLSTAPFLVVEGPLQNQNGVTSIRAERLSVLESALAGHTSRDYH
ncbi:MAG: DNA polymerase III subunit alpha [Acidobacteria bacterium]|nr:MAG: DNA polymerase III subunit alpha [Acidobacteriota bacterium]